VPHSFLQQADIFLYDVGRLVIWLVLLVALFVPLERLCGLPTTKIWRKQIAVDLAWYFVNSLLQAVIISVPLAFLARALRGLDPWGYYSAAVTWPLWIRVSLMLLVNDVGGYWGHRALHAWPWLWRFHAVHHSAEEMDWLVNTRAHPFDMVVTRLSGLVPVYLLGLAHTTGMQIDPAVALLMIIGTVWTFFLHANMRVRLGPLEWLISSPAFHHWHHTNDEHRDHNFAFIFPFIDRIFGTVWLPKEWPAQYGIDEKISPTLTGQFFDPLLPRSPSEPDKTAGKNEVSLPSGPERIQSSELKTAKH
jgi:sterol desaturase/sphingolipid hydroxylase (fatty acid hydroxylase superfamily)